MPTKASGFDVRPTRLPLVSAPDAAVGEAGRAVGVGAVSVAICDNSTARVCVAATMGVAVGASSALVGASRVDAAPPQAASARSMISEEQSRKRFIVAHLPRCYPELSAD